MKLHQRLSVVLLAVGMAGVVGACASGDGAGGAPKTSIANSSGAQAGAESTNSSMPAAQSESKGAPAADESACLGKLTPPRGAGGAGYIQETAFSTSDSIEALKARARSQLRDRLCQGVLCSMIDQHIDTWKSENSGGYRCVMVVIKGAHLADWKRRVETQLGERLADGAQQAVQNLRSELGGETPRVTIAKIPDHGIPGGPRSEWLYGNLIYALEEASADIVPLQPNWSGHGMPDKVDGVAEARIVALGGAEATMEVLWKIRTPDRVFPAPSVRFPETVAPEIDDSTYLPALDVNSEKVAIHFDSREGGGLCHGQSTEVWIETAEDMHVRVLNLYGNTGGMVIFPAREGQDDLVKAGQPVSIGKFEAMKVGDIGVERFLVVASPQPEGLGRFASTDEFCRMPVSMAGDMQYGRSLPEGDRTYLAATGFRLMDGEDCAAFKVDEHKVAVTRQALKSAPKCW